MRTERSWLRVRIVDGEVAHRDALAIGERGGGRLEIVERSSTGVALTVGDDRAARHAGGVEAVAGSGDEHAADRHG